MRYDTTLKELFRSPPRRLLTLLVGAPPAEVLTVEYPAVKLRRPDLVFRLPGGELHHLELQSGDDDQMSWRMLEYYPLLWREYGQAPVQQVLYVGARPTAMSAGIEYERLQFRYRVVDIREFEAAPLLESDSLADNLLAVLCRGGTRRAVVRRILRQVARLPEKQRLDRLTQLLILSGLRRAERVVTEEVRQMPFEIDIMENSFLRGIFLDGEKQGEKQGEKRGEKRGETRLLRRQLERRFGELPKWAVAQLEAASTATLEAWGLRLLTAETLEEVLSKGRAKRRRRDGRDGRSAQ